LTLNQPRDILKIVKREGDVKMKKSQFDDIMYSALVEIGKAKGVNFAAHTSSELLDEVREAVISIGNNWHVDLSPTEADTSNINATEKELAVLQVIADTMNTYQDGFSDVMVEDLVAETGFSKLTVRGLLGTLDQKGLIDYMDVNGEYNVYYVRGAATELLDFDLSKC
jgi:hypothetical protein